MLVRLFGRNFRSIKGDFELSMVAADLTRIEDRNRGVVDVRIEGMKDPLRLLRAAAIFGPNASGKSTLLRAAFALRWLATDSSPFSEPDAPIPPYEPFMLDDATRKSPVQLGCDVVLGERILRYEILFDSTAILTESLTFISDVESTVLIDRKTSGEVGGDLIARSDANRLYVKEIQPNVSVLSKLAQHGPRKGNESAYPFYNAIRHATNFKDYSAASIPSLSDPTMERFADDPDYREWIMHHLIRAADIGIVNVDVKREAIDVPMEIRSILEKSPGTFRIPDKRVVVSFIHQGNHQSRVDFSLESMGTKKLFAIAGDWWILGNRSIALLADELSASLHPRLLDRLIRAVNDLSKPNRSQLIFTTHDTGLLENVDGRPPALRRDQVYFTKKDVDGATELYSLAEFKEGARPVHNIRKRYLSGLYGAIPSIEKVSL